MGRNECLARWVGTTALTALALGYAGAVPEAAEPPTAKADGGPRRPARVVMEIEPDRVTHRPLRFVSLAPHHAREGDPYLYHFLLDEPPDDEVTVTLVRAPEGAVLDGPWLMWTPSHAQARHRQRFTLRAVDQVGQEREQSWSLVPGAEPLHAVLAGPRHHH